jgi:hypothetical protein
MRERATTPSSLNLEPDGDDVDFVQEVETVFGLHLTQADVGSWRTVGDVYDTICRLMPDDVSRDGACADAMAFYRIRRGLAEFAPGTKLKPGTPLRAFEAAGWRNVLDGLATRTGLAMPVPAVSGVVGLIALLLLLIGLFGWFALPWFIPASSLVAAVLLLRFGRVAPPAGSETLGGFARQVSALNYGRLRSTGSRVRPGDVWQGLLDISARHSSLPREKIGRDTLLLRP